MNKILLCKGVTVPFLQMYFLKKVLTLIFHSESDISHSTNNTTINIVFKFNYNQIIPSGSIYLPPTKETLNYE